MNGKQLILRWALCYVAVAALPQLCAAGRSRQVLVDGWYVKQLDSDKPDIAALARDSAAPDKTWLKARMPAEVQSVLLEHGLIPDPLMSDNAAKCEWIAKKDWAYVTRFRSPARGSGPTFLHFDGLDTLAAVHLNGKQIGTFNNMYRRYRVDVRRDLAPPGAENVLIVVFSSPVRFVDNVKLPPDHEGQLPKNAYLRKGMDLGPYTGARPGWTKVGMFDDVWLDTPGSGWIDDVWVRTELTPNFKQATLRVQMETGGGAYPVEWKLAGPDGSQVSRGTSKTSTFNIEVADPQLWWPRTHGKPNLYRLEVGLKDGAEELDSRRLAVGIREIKPVMTDPATGEKRFKFEVNGRPVYFQGANWAPLQMMTNSFNMERAKHLLDLAEHANMNIIRFWYGGVVAPDEFYEECDRRGIAVAHDFRFGGTMQPADDPEWLANVRLELEEHVKRLRNHPSLLFWIGGNENHMFVDWAGKKFTIGRDLFLNVIPEVVGRLDPSRFYHPNSPYGGTPSNWPLEGDYHDYTTLHFEPEASVPVWSMEIIRVAPPSLPSMRKFLSEDEVWPKGWSAQIRKPGDSGWPPAWDYHSTGMASWERIGAIEQLPDAQGPGDLIRNIGVAAGEYLKDRIERQRRGIPDGGPDGNRRNWGNIVWRLNDPWPMIYSALVDYYFEPKIAYYYVRRAYDPVLVSFEKTADRIHVWVVNDSPETVGGSLTVKRVGFDGKVLDSTEAYVQLAPAHSKRMLDLTGFGPITSRTEFLQASFEGHDSTMLLIGERNLHLPAPKLTVTKNGAGLQIRSDTFARQVNLEMEGVVGSAFEDNFFDLPPGQTRTIQVLNRAGGKAVVVRAVNAAPVRIEI